MTYDFFMGQLRVIAIGVISYLAGSGRLTTADASAMTAVMVPAGLLLGPWLWSLYVNVGKKLVPKESVAIQHVDGSKPDLAVGDSVNAITKVVGAILISFTIMALAWNSPLYAQTPLPKASPVSLKFLDVIRAWVSKDIDGAIALATAIPDLQDPNGAKCWQTFKGLGDVIDKHPLPITLKLATDIESARLVSMALKKVCVEPACAQVWLDIQNQVAALAPIGAPFTLGSICSKVL